MKRLVFLMLAACGPNLSDSSIDPTEETEEIVQDLSTRSPTDRVVIWQQNIEAMKAAKAAPWRLTNAMLGHPYKPDIVILAEAWQKVLCGDYRNPNASGDADLNNWKGSYADAHGVAYTCRLGRAPLSGSLLHRLGSSIWGSSNVEHRRPFSDTAGSTTRTGTPVIWDGSRFELVDDFEFDDSKVPGCGDALSEFKRTAVLLKDTRRTTGTSDDRLIAVASVHYATSCRTAANRWIAEEMVRRWKPDLRVVGGDFNASVDETSASYGDRRREERPADWYRGYTENEKWRGGRWLDAADVRHSGGSGDTARICGEWTYPNVSSCTGARACSSTCSGYGIGGQLMRIDFTFVSNRTGTLDRSRILSASTDDASWSYSDHKATYTVVAW